MKHIEAMKQAQDLRILADRFSEGWHDGIKIDASDIMLLATAAEAIEQAQKQEPVVGTKTWFEDDKVITQNLYSRDIYNTYPPQRQPLTDEQEYEAIGTAGNDLLELAKLWADNEIHVHQFDNEARKIIKAVLHRAYGIKGEV